MEKKAPSGEISTICLADIRWCEVWDRKGNLHISAFNDLHDQTRQLTALRRHFPSRMNSSELETHLGELKTQELFCVCVFTDRDQ